MDKLILVRHSTSEVVRGVPAQEWRLSAQGRRRVEMLVELLAPYAPMVIVSSAERKAAETATIVSAKLGLTCETVEGLHEHDRSNVDLLGREQFEATVADFFARPEEFIFGRETADQAHKRFASAVERVLKRYPDGNVAIVTHGTVISLFVASVAGIEPFAFWQRLEMPSFVVLSRPSYSLVTTVNMGGS